MLEYGSVTGLPDKYRITLAISVALLLHTLVMAGLPFTTPEMESHRQTVRVELVSPGSIPLPESTSSTTQTREATSENADSTPTQPATPPDVLTSTSSRSSPKPNDQAQSSTPSPRQAEAAEESQTTAPETPSRNSVSTAAGSPEPQKTSEPEVMTQLTRSPRDVDPYMASLAIHIGKELDERPVPSSSRVSEPVTSQLELRLLPSGALTSARVTKSTGFSEIDQAVYQAALLASPYPKPPEEYSGRKRFRVELIFSPERL